MFAIKIDLVHLYTWMKINGVNNDIGIAAHWGVCRRCPKSGDVNL